MTKREYQELREFLAVRFDALDLRFDGLDRRFGALEERLIRLEALAEERHHQTRIVAEGIESLQKTITEKPKAVRPEKAAGFDAEGRLLRGLGYPVRPLKA